MKFNQLAVALIASSGKIASVVASAIAEYTFVGNGHCLPAGTTAHFGHAAGNTQTSDVNTCAEKCRNENNIEGQVGFDFNSWNMCYCRYTAGTGPQGITSDAGCSYKQPGSFGPIAGSDVNGKCYRRNGFTSDAYGYVGDEYAFFGNGHCTPAGSSTHFSHVSTTINTPSVQICANHCRSLNNIEGQVGFDMNTGNTCYCRYTAGTGIQGDSTAGMSHLTGVVGPVGGTDGTGKCYRRIAFGQVSIWQIMRESIS